LTCRTATFHWDPIHKDGKFLIDAYKEAVQNIGEGTATNSDLLSRTCDIVLRKHKNSIGKWLKKVDSKNTLLSPEYDELLNMWGSKPGQQKNDAGVLFITGECCICVT
jgi:hypothetical protein